jgi:hypothetical protein
MEPGMFEFAKPPVCCMVDYNLRSNSSVNMTNRGVGTKTDRERMRRLEQRKRGV